MEQDNGSISLPANFIRAVAIILVILLHAAVESYTGVPLNHAESTLYWWSATIYNSIALPCVPLFIMLSGALLLRPYKNHEPIRMYLKKRVLRIGYAFAFWSVIYYLWSYFVHQTALTPSYIMKSLLNGGAYYHFWFFYLIAGLYLIVPILRVLTAYADPKILRYLIILWFIGVSVAPFIKLVSGFTVDSNLFLIGGWIGYFVLGAYLQQVKLQWSRRKLIGLLAFGYLWTIIGSWFMAFPLHYLGLYYFFFDSLTINVVIASVALYMLLSRFSINWPSNNHPGIGNVVRAISRNTLPLYAFHLIILESLHLGFFGFTISLRIMNPVYEVPFVTFLTLFITLPLILLMKKVPILKKLIG